MSSISKEPSKSQKKSWKGMYDYLLQAVDKVFYQVYDGEPVKHGRSNSSENILEEEVIFCKNNVCINVKSRTDDTQNDEIAGYLNMKKIYRSDCEYTDLILSWVPNKLLSAGSMEEAEIMLPPVPTEQINPVKEPSKYSSESVTQGDTEQKSYSDEEAAKQLNFSEIAKDFESPLGNVFGINIIDMKTVKLFYSSLPDNDAGQFVIGSPDNEYKVFHFHNGGLNKLAEIFDTWTGCSVDKDLVPEEDRQKVYYIKGKRKSLSDSKDEPIDEGRFKALNMYDWLIFMNSLGQIEDSFNFRKHVFYGGLSHEVRPDAWKFLLYYYPLHSTRKEREQSKEEKAKAYEIIHNKRLALAGKEYEKFWKNVQFTVDKDVVRTDRSHPYYAGQDNPNIQKMRNILLNYAIFNPSMGYSQGMSDLVAPVLAILHDEVDSFWCFVGLMESSMFATTPRDHSMDKSLDFLRGLLRLMEPDFYMLCLCTDEDMNLLFAHRWLVLCFKREFIFHEVLKIWEACWSRYQTDYFHIFICVAMVSTYGGHCLEKKMDSVDILQYFTEMATKFDGSAVLKKARMLLHKFRQFNKIPCTLRGLLSRKGVWDGGILPDIECVSNHKRCCLDLKDDAEDAADGTNENVSKDGLGGATIELNAGSKGHENETSDNFESSVKKDEDCTEGIPGVGLIAEKGSSVEMDVEESLEAGPTTGTEPFEESNNDVETTPENVIEDERENTKDTIDEFLTEDKNEISTGDKSAGFTDHRSPADIEKEIDIEVNNTGISSKEGDEQDFKTQTEECSPEEGERLDGDFIDAKIY